MSQIFLQNSEDKENWTSSSILYARILRKIFFLQKLLAWKHFKDSGLYNNSPFPALPGILLELEILESQPRLTESETLWVGPRNMYFNKPLDGSFHTVHGVLKARILKWFAIPFSKLPSPNYLTIALISHASKIMLKILQTRLQQYVNHEIPDIQTGFRKGRRTRDQIASIHWIIEKAKEFQKNSSLIDYSKASVWITTNSGKSLKRWEYQTTLPASWETCMQAEKQQLKPDVEQQTASKLGKEYTPRLTRVQPQLDPGIPSGGRCWRLE